jgi:hypothetical protein
MKFTKYCATLSMGLAFSVATQAQVAQNLYDGEWVGDWSCSENPSPTARVKGGWTKKVTFILSSNKGTFRWDGAKELITLNLDIDRNNNANIQGRGTRKANTNSTWRIKASGNVNRGTIKAIGSLTDLNGNVVRKLCTFDLNNSEVEARLASQHASNDRVPEQKAVTAKPAASKSAQTAKTQQRVVTTAPPKPVPATENAPARVAAIGNVDQALNKSEKHPHTKVTTNPIDSLKKTGPNDVWINFNPSITVQERQFCRLIENYRADYASAEVSKNQIKINEANKNFTQALNSLLPDGKFQGWVMRNTMVAQASNGSADVLFEMPCNVYVGSNACDPKNSLGTISEGSRVYTELAKMTVGDFGLVSGTFGYADEKTFDKNRSVASFVFMKSPSHCKANLMKTTSEFFGVKVDGLSTIK